MPEMIVCPVCGETNPADMEFCRNCQSRLHPLTGPLRGENSPIQPGELPTKKVTSELEPILPQWLRDARKQARETAAEEASKAEQEEKDNPPASAPDLLAGLASQARDEEDETPEWVAHITGTPAKKKKSVPDEGQVKWVELGHGDEPQESTVDEESGKGPVAPEPTEQGTEKDDLSEWFKQASATSQTADFRPPPFAPEGTEPVSGGGRPQSAEDLSWLKNLDAAAQESGQGLAETAPPAREEAPDWLKKLQAEQAPPEPPPAPPRQASISNVEVPAWLKSFGEETPPPAPEPEAPAPAEPLLSDLPIPDWLGAAEKTGLEEAAPPADLPDWVSKLGRGQAQEPLEETQPAEPAPEPEAPAVEAPTGPAAAFVEESDSGSGVDEIFASMQMPDWLSSLTPSQPAAEQNLPPAAQEELSAIRR